MARARSAPGKASGKGQKEAPAEMELRILVVSGPNLDRLGRREPAVYGKRTLEDIHANLARVASLYHASVDCRQSNHEGELVTLLNRAKDNGFHGILLNAAAYSHTSIALLDAIRASELPTVEVHLSNPEARESYRHVSLIASACVARVAGFRENSYALAFVGLVSHLRSEELGRAESR